MGRQERNMLENVFPECEIARLRAKMAAKQYDTNEKRCHLWVGAVDVRGYGRMQVTATDTDGIKHC